MTTRSTTARDSATMLRRNLRHQLRYPSVTVVLVGMPVIFLLLFVYILGGTLGAGLSAATGTHVAYVEYVVPGILLITIAAGTTGTAISVATDMTEGIVARFRTMAISRTAVLSGHVVGSALQTMLALTIVTGIAVAIGFRPTATAVEWLATIGVLLLITFALTWLAVALGTAAKSIESASNLPMPLLLLPFLGSGFVPTDSMPGPVGWFAEHQPFTAFIETIRGLLTGTPIGTSAATTAAWCAIIIVASYLWARASYERQSVRP